MLTRELHRVFSKKRDTVALELDRDSAIEICSSHAGCAFPIKLSGVNEFAYRSLICGEIRAGAWLYRISSIQVRRYPVDAWTAYISFREMYGAYSTTKFFCKLVSVRRSVSTSEPSPVTPAQDCREGLPGGLFVIR